MTGRRGRVKWLHRLELHQRPSGYEPDELLLLYGASVRERIRPRRAIHGAMNELSSLALFGCEVEPLDLGPHLGIEPIRGFPLAEVAGRRFVGHMTPLCSTE